MLPEKLKLGFTGTQLGCSADQLVNLDYLLRRCFRAGQVVSVHHGDCIGADEQFHDLVRMIWPKVRIIGHPSSEAYVEKHANCKTDASWKGRAPLARNKDIVNATDYLIACPKNSVELRRSGTWSTIRYARKLRRSVDLILPDGTIIHERRTS
jgi:hypothetical protein